MSTAIRINIDQPCHENWQNMIPHEQGRFCGSCQKMVVDFSMMTDKEILDYISKASSSICAQVSDDQVKRDIKVREQKKGHMLPYIWNLLLAGFLVSKADAQVTPVKGKKPPVEKVDDHMLMGKIAMPEPEKAVIPVDVKGVVIDSSNNQPIPDASIMIPELNRGTFADSTGDFKLSIDSHKPVELVISAIGYSTKTILVDKNTNWHDIKIALQPNAQMLGAVEVIGSSISCDRLAGAIGYTVRTTWIDTVKRTVYNWLPKKDVKAFPNPVKRGNNIQVSLALKEPGEYKLELMDAAGKVVTVQRVQMPEKERTISILTHEAWSAGVYWIRITGRQVYQTKVLITL